MTTDSDLDAPLEQFRSYLLVLARMQLDARPAGKIDPSDIVQQTLLEAHVQRHQYRGDATGLAAWLRKALANNIRDALRRMKRKKRDARRERSLEDLVDASSGRLEACLAAPLSSPSGKAIRQEDLLRLADALCNLPDGQREAVMLHHLQGWTLSEVAAQMDRTDAAVAGLLHRGLRKLKELMDSANYSSA